MQLQVEIEKSVLNIIRRIN